MEASTIIFYILAVIAIVFSVMAVTSTRILRAATYLLFVLLGTAGFYFLLSYQFLAAVQISVYAGGIVVLYVFAIMLTSAKGEKIREGGLKKKLYGASASLGGLALLVYVIRYAVKHSAVVPSTTDEINMKVIGKALMGVEKYQYLLPFEILSILLLACMIGGILIARKR
ncbi:MAG: NADH-quinone oxidoreductase subunit J [Dysgonamonadaceae bacterium]|jgi:NADH-quinone oxidoreductase subunit J|nr:NADH-quinone oxidoreductase subunit J [Dysgonamonadaceae bacterium]